MARFSGDWVQEVAQKHGLKSDQRFGIVYRCLYFDSIQDCSETLYWGMFTALDLTGSIGRCNCVL